MLRRQGPQRKRRGPPAPLPRRYTACMIVEPHGQRVTVMGLGRFGGGVGVTRWLAQAGARVTVTDLLDGTELAPALGELASYVQDGRVQLRLGGHRERDFVECDFVVVNPAVPMPWENRFLLAACRAGVSLTTEIGLTTERLRRRRVIGITGTAGKSTTAAMIHHVVQGLGHRCHLGGNIGGSLLEQLDDIRTDDWVVLELSSAMLWWLGDAALECGRAGWSPHVAVMTNLQPNHIDWHGTVEHYRRTKESIFRFQEPGDHVLHGTDGTDGADGTDGVDAATIPLTVPGRHNQANAQLAVAIAARVGLDPRTAARTLLHFPGLPHRLELVTERDGRRFFNDSKATTPQSTCLAVEAFDDSRRVHLLAGGYDKKVDLSGIVELAPRLAGLYTMGATGRGLVDATREGHAEFCETVEIAVGRAVNRMKPGDVLLLSPGCASWDQFKNYELRGAAFRTVVNETMGTE